jgi:hypothetical protein
MSRLYHIQLWTNLVVLLTLVAAEASAYMLAQLPGSMTLWYLNLEVFRPIQRATYLHSPVHALLGAYTGFAALALCILAAWAAWKGRRLSLAIVSHVCLIMVAGFSRNWLDIHPQLPETASLDPQFAAVLRLAATPDGAIMGPVCVAAIVATICGHLTFILKTSSKPRSSGPA